MAESGCIKNMNIESLGVNGIILGARRPTKLLVDKTTGDLDAITAAESGTIYLLPALTNATQAIALPSCANSVGCTYTFVVVGATAAQVFTVGGADSEKILAVKPKGDGDNTAISQGYDTIGFKAAAPIGSSFKVTCLSSTAAHAWLGHDIIDGIEINVGGIDLA